MTGWNMPPGVNPSDIPGNDDDEPPEDEGELPHPTAKWRYFGEWVEFQANRRMYRYRLARADDGSWERYVVEHQTRNGWAHVGKKVNEGVAVGRVMAATGLHDAELLRHYETIHMLERIVEDLAAELTAEINQRYGAPDVHPAMQKRYLRDLSTVHEAAEVLKEARNRR